MTRTGWAAMRQKIIPWMLVEIKSSDTPINLSVLSARVRQKGKIMQRGKILAMTLLGTVNEQSDTERTLSATYSI